MTEERREALRELINNRIAHRKAEEKFFAYKYEKAHPYKNRTGSLKDYAEKQRQAHAAHMAEYDRRVNKP